MKGRPDLHRCETERETCIIKTDTGTEDIRPSPAQNAEGKRLKHQMSHIYV